MVRSTNGPARERDDPPPVLGTRRAPHLPIAFFVVFLWAGVFKGTPLLRDAAVDLTLLSALLCVSTVPVALMRTGMRVATALLWVLLLYATLSVPLLWTDWAVYAQSKVTRMFTLTLLTMVFPMLWITDWKALKLFFRYLATSSAVICVVGVWTLVTEPVAFALEVFANDYITTGRVAGVLAIWLLLLVIHGRGPRRIAPLAALPVPIAVIVASGSKGPTLALLLSLAALGALAYAPRVRFWGPAFAVGVILVSAVAVSYSVAPPGARARLAAFYSGQTDLTATMRPELFASAWEGMRARPQGTGWGGFERVWTGGVEREQREGPVQRHYPHNLVIETSLEGGWQAGLVLLVLLAAAIAATIRAYRRTGLVEAHLLFALLVFFLAGSMFSGDWNDNRDLLAVVSIALLFGRSAAPKPGALARPDVTDSSGRVPPAGRRIGDRGLD